MPRGRPGVLSQLDYDRILEMERSGMTMDQIGEAIGVSTRTVHRYRVRGGICSPTGGKGVKATPEWKEKVQKLLAEDYSHRAIAQLTGVCAQTVARHFPGTAWDRKQISEMGKATQMLNRIGVNA
jgi:IS30 family transposase